MVIVPIFILTVIWLYFDLIQLPRKVAKMPSKLEYLSGKPCIISNPKITYEKTDTLVFGTASIVIPYPDSLKRFNKDSIQMMAVFNGPMTYLISKTNLELRNILQASGKVGKFMAFPYRTNWSLLRKILYTVPEDITFPNIPFRNYLTMLFLPSKIAVVPPNIDRDISIRELDGNFFHGFVFTLAEHSYRHKATLFCIKSDNEYEILIMRKGQMHLDSAFGLLNFIVSNSFCEERP